MPAYGLMRGCVALVDITGVCVQSNLGGLNPSGPRACASKDDPWLGKPIGGHSPTVGPGRVNPATPACMRDATPCQVGSGQAGSDWAVPPTYNPEWGVA